ncbi:MAG: hypothetical protein HYR62_09825 [Actinobacteria bacterium]|nr:hypothetical protein [Actinomycetota bacterium]MBI3686453.1 hypothetical protein [Actinomycetota bacterium]
MSGVEAIEITLDTKVLDRVADLICGDDTTPYYRPGYEIAAFFEAAGWSWTGPVEGGRRAWVIEQLRERKDDPAALAAILLRVVDPREYLDDPAVRTAVFDELNKLLAVEGYEVVDVRGESRLRRRERTFHRLDSQTPVELVADMSAIVSDQEFGAMLDRRLIEARTCWQQGAPLAAVIMLGSLLEGVLYTVACARLDQDRQPRDHLQSLIDIAGREGWVAKDVVDYAHVLREHRNLVHPRRQHLDGHAPDSDSVRIAWNIVVAALNDLAVPPGEPTQGSTHGTVWDRQP